MPNFGKQTAKWAWQKYRAIVILMLFFTVILLVPVNFQNMFMSEHFLFFRYSVINHLNGAFICFLIYALVKCVNRYIYTESLRVNVYSYMCTHAPPVRKIKRKKKKKTKKREREREGERGRDRDCLWLIKSTFVIHDRFLHFKNPTFRHHTWAVFMNARQPTISRSICLLLLIMPFVCSPLSWAVSSYNTIP